MPCGPPHRGRIPLRCACRRLSAPCGSIVDMADERGDRGEVERDDAAGAGSVRAAVDAPGLPSDVVREARAALATGQAWKARDLLEEHLETERDTEAMKLLGEVLHRMGDLPGAGAAWFATSAKGPLIDEAIAAWRADHDDDFMAMWASIPAAARREPLTPKLSALRAKALEADPKLDDAHPSDTGADRAEAQAPRRRAIPALTDPPGPTDSSARPNPPARRDPAEAVSSPTPKDTGAGGFDAAKVIAWILAALFVVCAVVGLITILQWIVPGS